MRQVTIKKDIYNGDGVLLLSKGQEVLLSSAKLEFLKKHGNYEELICSEEQIAQPSQTSQQVTSPQVIEHGNSFDVSPMVSEVKVRLKYLNSNTLNRASEVVEKVVFQNKEKDWHVHFSLLLSYDYWLYTHSINNALISCIIGINLNFTDSELENLVLGAIFHDIGLTLLPKSVFQKTTELTAVELSILRNHCDMGYAMMQETSLSTMSKDIILQHHENLQGSGYPNQLKESQLLKASQIVMVSECFDTATTGRYRKKIKTPLETLEEMTVQSDIYPQDIVRILKGF